MHRLPGSGPPLRRAAAVAAEPAIESAGPCWRATGLSNKNPVRIFIADKKQKSPCEWTMTRPVWGAGAVVALLCVLVTFRACSSVVGTGIRVSSGGAGYEDDGRLGDILEPSFLDGSRSLLSAEEQGNGGGETSSSGLVKRLLDDLKTFRTSQKPENDPQEPKSSDYMAASPPPDVSTPSPQRREQQCPAGQRLAGGKCTPCARGSYSNEPSQSCKACPADTYQPAPGQYNCLGCPQGSRTRPYHLGQTDIKDCICTEGYEMRLAGSIRSCVRSSDGEVMRPRLRDAHKIEHLKPSEIGHRDPLFFPGLFHLLQFAMVVVSSAQVGRYLTHQFSLPLISGYLVAGICAGPHLLGLLSHATTKDLRLIDQLSISAIALAAGLELRAAKLAQFLRPICMVLSGFMGVTFVVSFLVVLGFSAFIPFVAGMTAAGKTAVALLISTIMVARSPASAIAIVRDVGAEGPFSTIIVGVSIAADVLIIVVFALNMSIAKSLIRGGGLDATAAIEPMLRILWSAAAGLAQGHLLVAVTMTDKIPKLAKDCIVILSGLGAFHMSSKVPEFLAFEPLLACVLCGVYVVNSGSSPQLANVNAASAPYCEDLMCRALPYVNLFFFTSAGAELEIDHLLRPELFVLGLGIFTLRLGSLWLGATLGGYIAGRPSRENSLAWMGYVTQAGVAMGLARDVAREFPAWGQVFASMMIFQMAINQIIGPPLFKYAIVAMGEAKRTASVVSTPKSPKSRSNSLDRGIVAAVELQEVTGGAVGRKLAAVASSLSARSAAPAPEHKKTMIDKRKPDGTAATD